MSFIMDASARRNKGRNLSVIPLNAIQPNPYQPRRTFSERGVSELAQSIRQYGLLSPVLVRKISPARYELIAGERRLRAMKLIGLTETQAFILPAYDKDSALLALIENLQRENLSYFEEADAYMMLITEHHLMREELARKIGRSPSSVANRLRLLKLPPSVRAELVRLNLSERHARALIRLDSEQLQLKALSDISKRGLNVARTESLIESMLTEKPARPENNIRLFLRDKRMFINTILTAVKTLTQSGLNAASTVEETEDTITITVVWTQGETVERKERAFLERKAAKEP